MIRKKNNTTEYWNNGRLTVLNAEEGTITSEKGSIPFGYKTVGIKRFYNAAIAGSEIQKVVSVPDNNIVKQKDLIELFDFKTGERNIYRVDLLQEKDTVPRSIWLTLIKDDVIYDDNRA